MKIERKMQIYVIALEFCILIVAFYSWYIVTEHDFVLFSYEIPFKVSNGDNEELLVLPVYLREIK